MAQCNSDCKVNTNERVMREGDIDEKREQEGAEEERRDEETEEGYPAKGMRDPGAPPPNRKSRSMNSHIFRSEHGVFIAW